MKRATDFHVGDIVISSENNAYCWTVLDVRESGIKLLATHVRVGVGVGARHYGANTFWQKESLNILTVIRHGGAKVV